jgi:hypothetical protein
MGWDMYCVVEALNKKTKNWECFGVSTGECNYTLFSRIADVCNSEDEKTYIEPIDDPRGWPVDVSGPADAWYHTENVCLSATWLNRAELESLDKWLQEEKQSPLWELLSFKHLSSLFNLRGSWKKAAFTRFSDLRVLFFFSNGI